MNAPPRACWLTTHADNWRAITLKGPWDFPIVAPHARAPIAFWSVPVPSDPASLPPPKLCENRGWSTRWRGPLLIHSGKGWDAAAAGDPRVQEMWRAICGSSLRREAWTWAGHVTAVAELVDCHPSRTGCCHPWGQYHPTVYHHVLADVRVLTEPVWTLGRQSMWRPSASLVERVRAAIPAEPAGVCGG